MGQGAGSRPGLGVPGWAIVDLTENVARLIQLAALAGMMTYAASVWIMFPPWTLDRHVYAECGLIIIVGLWFAWLLVSDMIADIRR